MAYKYPFKSGEELKQSASQVNLDIDIKNIDSSLRLAAKEYKESLGNDLYKLMIDHYNSANYTPDDYSDVNHGKKNELVDISRGFIGNLGLYEHFIWLQIHVSDKGVTTYKSEDETSAFQYQTIEAKEKLLKLAWGYFNDLIDFLDKNALSFEDWTKSDQYKELKELIFTGYRDFEKYFGIDKNAAYYVKLRYIIREIVIDDIKTRIENINQAFTDNEQLKEKIKQYVAYRAVAISIRRFTLEQLPETMRKMITENSNLRSSISLESAKNSVLLSINNKADGYLAGIDVLLAQAVKSDDLSYQLLPSENQEMFDDDKFASMI